LSGTVVEGWPDVQLRSKGIGPRNDARYHLLSVIVPVYNERNTIGEILRRMRNVDLPIDREIVVVNDGSVDGTDKVLAALEDSTVKVVTHPANRGKGVAVRTGVDADLGHDPQGWPRLLAPLLQGRTKVVYGSRYMGEREAVSIHRWAGDRSLSLLTAVLFNATVSGIEPGYKAFDRQLLVDLQLRADRFELESEITAKLLREGQRIFEVPIRWTRPGEHDGRKFSWRDQRPDESLFDRRWRLRVTAAWTLIRLRFRPDIGAPPDD
jgi:glycosyltransferase involved in cell wall biosynthesis